MLQLLAKRLNLTSLELDPEPYILTEDEENRIIENEVVRLKSHAAWKMKQISMTEYEIEAKLSMINWEERYDRQAILMQANSVKNHDLWQKEQRQKEKDAEKIEADELAATWTAKRVFSLMSWASENIYGKKLIVKNNEYDNTKLITTLCFFISKDPRFESELGYSLDKGLLIRGISGLGKTHLVKCIKDNELNPIILLSMLEITDTIRDSGEYSISLGDRKIIYLDDVGTEEPVIKHYGTNITFFKNFIETYYLQSKPFNRLMISTNNSFSEMEQKYGFRVRSRIKDMFNIVDISGKDMRG